MHSAQPKKSLGQHWLTDESVLDHICEDAGIAEGDHVLEIGPGLGTLTERIIQKGARVTALEFDHELVVALRSSLGKKYLNDDLEIQEGDIRSYDFRQLPNDYIICANIPYYLTSNLLRLLCDTPNKPVRAALLMQKEVAERVTASDGKMSIISCIVHFYYDCIEGVYVPASYFTPPPKVDSLVLVMQRRLKPLFDVDEKQFFRLIKAGFASKRKNLRNTLSVGMGLTKDEVVTLLESVVIDPNRRAESLSLYEWKSIYDNLTR